MPRIRINGLNGRGSHCVSFAVTPLLTGSAQSALPFVWSTPHEHHQNCLEPRDADESIVEFTMLFHATGVRTVLAIADLAGFVE